MLFDSFFDTDGSGNAAAVKRLSTFHERRYSLVLWVLLFGLLSFIGWATIFKIDEVAKATGEVIASSRVQIIQSVDGGVLAALNVREGDRVEPGQILAQLDQTRFGASVNEIDARLSALKIKAIRLRAEVVDAKSLVFPENLMRFPEQVLVEQALFEQRRSGLLNEVRTLKTAIALSREELALVKKLSRSGDVNRSETIRTERALNETKAKLIIRKNRYLEEASAALAKTEDEMAQNEQILTQRIRQLDNSVFKAVVPGIVKNIRVTTVGGVLRAGEELMQIIPVDDELIIEAKVSPADIARIASGLKATLRFDPFDYTIYGGVNGEVVYVSADTLKEDTQRGEEIYYRVHVVTKTQPVTTTTGRVLDILPGMTAQIDIRTGERTVMDYLLKPLRKTVSDSFGER
ncbi:HlyD family efflux transporter periplasmic adaptor subunit [Neptunomonas sp.]|uniref:HlyD family efflux transporter periplasmic adaptor subunit n=1 Tax=Neptunomonas sp. TaxID=1971898 RepID=UPI0025F421BE|nr:HlyD family efflux transporter periplasmic adaptor subunit [Neptunomonas sp.]